MTQRNLTRSRSTLLTLALGAAAVLLGAPAAEAQNLTAFYPVKVVCGFVPGNVPPLAGLSPFINTPPNTDRDQEPGHYATTVNILHNQFQNDTLVAWYIDDRLGAVSVPLPIANPFGPFQSLDIGCTDLAPLLGLGVGAPFEGWLVLFVTTTFFDISPVYTFVSQNGFIDHQQFQVDATGTRLRFLTGFPNVNPFDLYYPAGIAVPPLPLPTNAQPGDVEASGAGGLGLGASIDVEVVDSVALGTPMSPDELAERMSSLDFQPYE